MIQKANNSFISQLSSDGSSQFSSESRIDIEVLQTLIRRSNENKSRTRLIGLENKEFKWNFLLFTKGYTISRKSFALRA